MISIAIDGPAGAGKSTLARRLASELGFIYVDTGALYRAVALSALRAGIDPADSEAVKDLLPQTRIDVARTDGLQHVFLNGEDVTSAIREERVSMGASSVSAVPEVRKFLLELQRGLARTSNVLMDGRDIGTVILPNAQVKIFLTAAPEARAMRRWKEQTQKGESITYEKVLEDVIRRDRQDSERETAPLRQADDAVLVDTSDLDFEESFEALLSVIRGKLQQ